MTSLRGQQRREFPLHGNVKNLHGQTFGKWTVLTRAESANGRARWNCRCSCGTEKIVYGGHLLSGRSTQCLECRPGHPTHGKSDTQLYVLWMGMNARCNADEGENYQNYKARGIAVCERWKDFAAFEGDMGSRPSARHSIDRRDNSRGYEPSNCYWATQKQQMRNMRRNRLVEYQGQRMPLVEACELSGVKYGTAKWRLDNGRTDVEAFS